MSLPPFILPPSHHPMAPPSDEWLHPQTKCSTPSLMALLISPSVGVAMRNGDSRHARPKLMNSRFSHIFEEVKDSKNWLTWDQQSRTQYTVWGCDFWGNEEKKTRLGDVIFLLQDSRLFMDTLHSFIFNGVYPFPSSPPLHNSLLTLS